MLTLLLLIGCESPPHTLAQQAHDAEATAMADLVATALLGEHGVNQPWPACAPGACVAPTSLAVEVAARLHEAYQWRVDATERGGSVCVRVIETARCVCAPSGAAPVEIPCEEVRL